MYLYRLVVKIEIGGYKMKKEKEKEDEFLTFEVLKRKLKELDCDIKKLKEGIKEFKETIKEM